MLEKLARDLVTQLEAAADPRCAPLRDFLNRLDFDRRRLEDYITAARDVCDEDLSMDDNPLLSLSQPGTGGMWVGAWIWFDVGTEDAQVIERASAEDEDAARMEKAWALLRVDGSMMHFDDEGDAWNALGLHRELAGLNPATGQRPQAVVEESHAEHLATARSKLALT